MCKVSFKDSNNNTLVGIIDNPSCDKNQAIIIICHGFASNKESRDYVTLATKLNKHRISTFRYDHFGHGESEGDFSNLTISKAVDGLLCAIEYLKNKNYENIGIYGCSFGGLIAIIGAAKVKESFAMALECPVCNSMEQLMCTFIGCSEDDWKQKGSILYKNKKGFSSNLNYSFYQDSIKIDGYKLAECISIPTLIIHGDADEIVPVEQAKKMSGIIKNCQLEIIEKGDHNFSNEEDFQLVKEKIKDFFISESKKIN